MGVRLSPDTWSQIEADYRAGRPAKRLAKIHGVSASAIFHRSSLERWRDTPRVAAKPTQAERIEQAADRLEAILKRMSEDR
ncbi:MULTISPECIES: hypothetical protein [Paraburkholderia]|uniref:Transposase n=1 Tax=Paraburkholderia podalyriae TaxID=1938811 RepID=A0ABR7PQG2_9BURK|nr:hypothetical protein [Paraburkholderia podalyriae]MBC8748523.1 hypothetical protein [Paraburkholderia podalyriae]